MLFSSIIYCNVCCEYIFIPLHNTLGLYILTDPSKISIHHMMQIKIGRNTGGFDKDLTIPKIINVC